MSLPHLDDLTYALAGQAVEQEGLPAPDCLLLLGTGFGTLPGALQDERRLPLGQLDGVPEAWSAAELVAGRLGDASVWMLEDAPAHATWTGPRPDRPAWERAWPVWFAAAAGATLGLVTAAGIGLGPRDGPPAVGALVALADHLNLSGNTPLRGLGESRLGPLFPDATQVHHEGLRVRALERARSRGLELELGTGACLVGPSSTTPAEVGWLRSTGASVAVQGLADPLIAAAHAGLSCLTLVAVTDCGSEPLRMADLVERAEACAPALEELILHLGPDLVELACDPDSEPSA